MKRKTIDVYDNSLKRQKISKKRNRDEIEETLLDIIPDLKKVKISYENEKDTVQKYLRYKRDILIYT
jgi:hypothetical protein